MKTMLGLLVLCTLSNAEAKSGQLLLRAQVPAVYQIKFNNKFDPEIVSNRRGQVLPKLLMNKKFSGYFVTIVHP
jgi:hypothetical protein